MSGEKIVSVMRDFNEAYVKRDVEKMLSFLTEDVVSIQFEGTFKGKEEAKRYLTWDAQMAPDVKFRDAGIGVIANGNKVVWEWVFEGSTPDGRRWREIPGITVYEFDGEKIQQFRWLYDRLAFARQLAKGWLERKIVGTIVNRIARAFLRKMELPTTVRTGICDVIDGATWDENLHSLSCC